MLLPPVCGCFMKLGKIQTEMGCFCTISFKKSQRLQLVFLHVFFLIPGRASLFFNPLQLLASAHTADLLSLPDIPRLLLLCLFSSFFSFRILFSALLP